jgi:hypothetical protein
MYAQCARGGCLLGSSNFSAPCQDRVGRWPGAERALTRERAGRALPSVHLC